MQVQITIGVFWTSSRAAVRRSRVTLSPIRAENQHSGGETPVPATSTTTMRTANRTVTHTSLRAMMTSATRPARTRVATARSAPPTGRATTIMYLVRQRTVNVMTCEQLPGIDSILSAAGSRAVRSCAVASRVQPVGAI